MSFQTSGWETRLLALATEALSSPVSQGLSHPDDYQLASAYAHCAEITRENSRTFYMASRLLPAPKRQAAHALYAFCRVTDDLVDNATDAINGRADLAHWRARVQDPHPHASESVLFAWADTQARFGIPRGYAEQLIDGVGRDLSVNRYETFESLSEYCYGAASTVGLMVMHLIGFAGEQALPYAVKLGVALQMTNILRDVQEDWLNGRLYLPQEDLARFKLSEDDIALGRVDARWVAFMQFQIARTRQLYAEAAPGIGLLNADGRFAIAAASGLYEAILRDIEQHNYDVFTRRAHLSTWGKLRRLPRIWWQAHNARPKA